MAKKRSIVASTVITKESKDPRSAITPSSRELGAFITAMPRIHGTVMCTYYHDLCLHSTALKLSEEGRRDDMSVFGEFSCRRFHPTLASNSRSPLGSF